MIRNSQAQEKPFRAVCKSFCSIWGDPKCAGLKAYNTLQAIQLYSFNGHTRSAVRRRNMKVQSCFILWHEFCKLLQKWPFGLDSMQFISHGSIKEYLHKKTLTTIFGQIFPQMNFELTKVSIFLEMM